MSKVNTSKRGVASNLSKSNRPGRSYSSVGRAGVPCIEAVGPLQRSQVRLPPVTHLLHVIPYLSALFPVVSSAVPIKLKAKAQKIFFKKKNFVTFHLWYFYIKH